MFSDPEMMSMVMDSVGGVLYERLKKKTVYTMPERTLSMAVSYTHLTLPTNNRV